MNARATTRRLNLYSSGTAANGMNVVLYTNDNTNEQKWYFDGDSSVGLYPAAHRAAYFPLCCAIFFTLSKFILQNLKIFFKNLLTK